MIQSKFLLTKDDGPLPEEKDENAALQFAKGAGDVALDFIGFHDAKAAITGVDEDGNEIGWGERLFRGALVVPIAKPVKGRKMALKYGDKALTAGKKNLDNVARKGKKTACGCPKKITAKEASEAAKKLGFKKTNYKSHGQPVFKKGNKYITPDVDQHKGEGWKMADSVKNLKSKKTRMGTYDANLNRIGD
ncbi:hypothetical protein JOD24_003184 [Kroppenstedtia sanguinis]